jgi:hypothetical protein
MKTIKIYILALATILLCSCNNFFDIVPDDIPALDNAFSNRNMLRKSLFTCYSYLPDPTDPFNYPAYYTNKGEFCYGISEHFQNLPSIRINKGNQNTNSPLLNYWSGGNGGSSMFQALRFCNIFLENAYIPQDITEPERAQWIAEVKFLKAYYHFFLLQLYGPIPVIRENLPMSASPEELRIYREPVDECIDYIVQLCDEAAPDLPLVIANTTEELGRITRPIALAIKAKALVWGASPLFNGNPYYAHWVDKRGVQLISSTPDNRKWEKAATALEEAINIAHDAGHALFEYNKNMNSNTINMNDSLVYQMNVRKGITQRWNMGVIWSSTENFAQGKGGLGDKPPLGNMQRDLCPVLFVQDATLMMGYCPAAFEMAELFYSKHGVPIDEDKDYAYENIYKPRIAGSDHRYFIAANQETAGLNFDREYRFYADLGFDRGYYELSAGTSNQGASFTPYLQLRAGEASNLSNPVGYYVKKLVSFESRTTMGNASTNYVGDDYRFPLLRLADLYLLYSEALNEVKSSPDSEVYYWIDLVREKAGLDGVVASWRNYSSDPGRPADKNNMREIIHQERLIELAFEGQRFWDVRRWHEADRWFNQLPKCWNYNGKTSSDYYTLLNYEEPSKYSEKDYLWPISASDIRINSNLVQTYGW